MPLRPGIKLRKNILNEVLLSDSRRNMPLCLDRSYRQPHPPPSLFSLHLSFILATTEGGRGRERTRGNTKEEERGQGVSVYRTHPPHIPLSLFPSSTVNTSPPLPSEYQRLCLSRCSSSNQIYIISFVQLDALKRTPNIQAQIEKKNYRLCK